MDFVKSRSQGRSKFEGISGKIYHLKSAVIANSILLFGINVPDDVPQEESSHINRKTITEVVAKPSFLNDRSLVHGPRYDFGQ